MDRRQFLSSSLATGLISASVISAQAREAEPKRTHTPFRLNYAPHFGMFKHHGGKDPIDQLKFMTDQGFTALEDNGMMGRPVELQKKISREMSRLNMDMGVFVTYANFDFETKTFVSNSLEVREMLIKKMKEGVETAQRVNAKWTTIVPGTYHPGMEWDYQTANVIEHLKYLTEICEPSGLVIVLEPLNHWANHPGLFLTKIPQAYQICKAVDSPCCKILDDLYHQQVTEGNLIPNIDMAWDQIAYFQIGDNPGRNEPTTGEINYQNVFKHIYNKGFKGIIGMEHGNSQEGKEGEKAVIDAYRYCDSF